MRKQLADRLTYEAYRDYAPVSIEDAQMRCPLTQTMLFDLGEPATILAPAAKTAVPYEFAAMVQWWWQTGTIPLSEVPMPLSAIRPVCIDDRP